MDILEGMDYVGGKAGVQDHHTAIWKDLYSAIRDLVSGDATVHQVSNEGEGPEFLVHIRTDIELNITYSNDIANDVYKVEGGLRRKNLVGAIVPKDRETVNKVKEWLSDVIDGSDKGLSLIVSMDMPEGLRWFSFAAEPLRSVDGCLSGTWWAGRDITASISSSVKGKSTFETTDLVTKMSLPSMTVSADGEIVAWNSAWAAEFRIPKEGYSGSKEMLGALLSAVNDPSHVIDGMLKATPNGPTGTVVMKDGAVREFHIIAMTKEADDKVIVLEPFQEPHVPQPVDRTVMEPHEAKGGKLMELVNIIDFIVEEDWDGMFVVDEAAKVTKWDRNMAAILHMPPAVAVGKDLIVLDEMMRGLGRLKALIPQHGGDTSSEATTGPFFIEVADTEGEPLSLEVHMFPVTTGSGRVITFWCSRLGSEKELVQDDIEVRAIVEDENSFLAVTNKYGYIIYASPVVDRMMEGSTAMGRNIVELLPDWSDSLNGSRHIEVALSSGTIRYTIGALRISGPKTHYVFHGTPKGISSVSVIEEIEQDEIEVETDDGSPNLGGHLINSDPPCWSRLREICYRAAEKMGEKGFEMLGEMNDVEVYADPHLVNVLLLMLDDVLNNSTEEDHIEMAFFQDTDGGRIVISNIGVISPLKRRWESSEVVEDQKLFKDLVAMKAVLDVTDLELEVNNENDKGLRFEIFIPNDKIRDFINLDCK